MMRGVVTNIGERRTSERVSRIIQEATFSAKLDLTDEQRQALIHAFIQEANDEGLALTWQTA